MCQPNQDTAAGLEGDPDADPTLPFDGAKIAVIRGDLVLAILRDDRPDIPHPGLWDLPGGGREGDEAPDRTALRELEEELGLRLNPARIVERRRYQAERSTWFFLALWPELDLSTVRFGDEGQRWAAMPVAEFLAMGDAVPPLQARLARVWPRWQPGS